LTAGAFDALLLASFGGPEGQDDVIPFLRNVTAGRGIPDERLEEVAGHYRHFGGVSPINAQNRALKAALEKALAEHGVDLPVYWGNRNWKPYFTDALRDAHSAHHDRLLALVTSAYTSYSGVGQYREDFEGALAQTGLAGIVTIDRIREFFDHPGFIAPLVDGVRDAVSTLADGDWPGSAGIHVLFVTHSIPVAAAEASGEDVGKGGAYVAQHRAVADLIAHRAAPGVPYSLAYQSRSGNPATPWLEPDVNDEIARLAERGTVRSIVVVPIGFVSDHMEVLWDLDNEAAQTAQDLGLRFARVPTVGVHPRFIDGVVDLIMERVGQVPSDRRKHETALGPWPDHPTVTGLSEADEAEQPNDPPARDVAHGVQA
jgi:ferrochelatase